MGMSDSLSPFAGLYCLVYFFFVVFFVLGCFSVGFLGCADTVLILFCLGWVFLEFVLTGFLC